MKQNLKRTFSLLCFTQSLSYLALWYTFLLQNIEIIGSFKIYNSYVMKSSLVFNVKVAFYI